MVLWNLYCAFALSKLALGPFILVGPVDRWKESHGWFPLLGKSSIVSSMLHKHKMAVSLDMCPIAVEHHPYYRLLDPMYTITMYFHLSCSMNSILR